MIAPPRKAFLLAAGFGTRLLPLTRVVPKPLLPLGGIPMIDRALAMVRAWGVRDVVVNVHHGADAMVRHLVERTPDGLRIQISFEPDILGTGGALTRASWFFRDHQPFWIVNADVAAEVNVAPLLRAFRPGRTMCAAWLMSTCGPRTVECRNGKITNFESKKPGMDGTYTFCGVHLVDPAVVRYLPPEGFASVVNAYRKAMNDGWQAAGVPIEQAFWADIGTPDQYVKAEADLRRHGAGGKAGRTLQVGHEQVRIVDGIILGPGVPAGNYHGIMALRARDALDGSSLKLVEWWAGRRSDALVACPLAPRGSARSFVRVYAGKRSAMLVSHSPERAENDLYVEHARFLKSLGLPVPAFLAGDALNRVALFEDAGTVSVQDAAPGWSGLRLAGLYEKILDALVIFHEAGYAKAKRLKLELMPPFDERLYRWEHELFIGLFLRERMKVDEATLERVKDELKLISRRLARARPVLLHRDLQSSNILLRGWRWTLIDFQGMRFGPAVYDLASLLCDPYLRMDDGIRNHLLDRYAKQASPLSQVRELFWPAAVQRLGQALGAYARLSKVPGTGHFARHIAPALRNMAAALERLPGLPALKDVVNCLAAENAKP